ncbi:MAG: tetratricopeptide repeat protein [Planctomycetes bacterium]|nr:tetratricopeptide repeat protein [Planctomycetota bacterium]
MRALVLAALAATVCLSGGSSPPLAAADEKKDKELMKLLDEIESAAKAKNYEEVLKLAKKAAELDPKNPGVHFAAGTAHAALRQHDEAATAFTEVIKLEPKSLAARDRRGDAYLKSGKFAEAVADFDAYIKERPKDGPDHWRRGLALYYAGRFKDGATQFNAAEGNAREDVENSAWHYLCNARATTPKKAREELIPVTKDARVPMNKILDLFAGKLKPKDVLDAAEGAKLAGEPLKSARFYANLYVALYYESEGDAKKCLEHMTEAVEKYKIGDYMWDIASVHLKVLKAKK